MTARSTGGSRTRTYGVPRRSTINSIIITLVVFFAAIIWLLPTIAIVLTSLKSPADLIGSSSLSLPTEVFWDNYPSAWQQANFSEYMFNSVIICLIKVPLSLLVGSMLAFGLSRFRYRLRKPLFILIVAGAMVPVQIPLISLFHTLIQVKLINTHLALIILLVAFSLPFIVLFMTAFFNQIPMEIEEAARVDGCTPWRYFRQIALPLSRPLLATLFIIDLVGTWNEFGIAVTILIDNSKWTAPLGLLGFREQFTINYNGVSAAVVMAAIPVVVIYLMLQRYFERGFVAGAVKG